MLTDSVHLDISHDRGNMANNSLSTVGSVRERGSDDLADAVQSRSCPDGPADCRALNNKAAGNTAVDPPGRIPSGIVTPVSMNARGRPNLERRPGPAWRPNPTCGPQRRTHDAGLAFGALLTAVLSLLLAIAPVRGLAADPEKTVALERAKIEVRSRITKVQLQFSTQTRVGVFTLSRPYRLVLDLPEIAVSRSVGREAVGGLIKAFRSGLVANGHTRLIFDVAGPFKLVDVRAESLPQGGSLVRLDIGQVSAASFKPQGVPPRLPRAAALRSGVFDHRDNNGKPARKRRPVVIIDPGHGGPDPGAVGARGRAEKDIVLAVALRVAKKLSEGRRYDVVLTRRRDVFVSLDDRVALSRQRRGDLFVSLHADALAATQMAAKVSGATIYTLSRVASDSKAAELARKENATDALAGLPIAPNAARGRIEAILFDLMRRETADFSIRLREHLIRRMQRAIQLSRSPRRSAAFKVLQQPETPAVLIELGYMSNPSDVREMARPRWQTRAAEAITTAIHTFLGERTVARP